MEAVIEGNESEIDVLVIEISKIVERPVLQSSTECRIYKVPYLIRKWNSEAYTPQVISIGPFHHGNPRLKDMEEVKESNFSRFVRRCNLNVGVLVRKVKELEVRIRGCYDGTIDFDRDRFVKMILVDACFILELFLQLHLGMNPLTMEPRATVVMLDLLLLENQIPFFFY